MENINEKETNVYRKIGIYFKFKNNRNKSPHQVVVCPPAGSIPLIHPPDLAVLSPWAEGLGGPFPLLCPFFVVILFCTDKLEKQQRQKKSRETL